MQPNLNNIDEHTVIHIKAPNDTNGNPRRLYLVVHVTDGAVAAIDEGYYGAGMLTLAYGKELGNKLYQRTATTINVNIKEYKALLKSYPYKA